MKESLLRTALIAVVFVNSIGAAPSDPLYSRFLGSWSCTTAASSSVTETFAVNDAGSMTMLMRWHELEGWKSGKFDATVTQSNSGVWTTTNHGYGLTFNGSSSGFVGDDLEFVGTQSRGDNPVPTREQFHFVSGRQFEHKWVRQAPDGTWRVTSHAMCFRSAT